MLTRQEAETAREFHHASATQAGGRECYRVRRNGRTQTWKTRPEDFRLPVVHGLRGYGTITHHDAVAWHVADTCPRCASPALTEGQTVTMRGGFTAKIVTLYPAGPDHAPYPTARIRYAATGRTETVPVDSLAAIPEAAGPAIVPRDYTSNGPCA